MIELTDAVEVLVSKSGATPAVPLLRSAFEALLSLEYILEDNAHYTSRSLAWTVSYILERLDLYDRLDPATTKGQDFQAAAATDQVLSAIQLPAQSDLDQQRQAWRTVLQQPHLQPIADKLQSYNGRPAWHRLNGGPRTIRELAHRLNREAQYFTIYASWSQFAHAQDAPSLFVKTQSGRPGLARLREPADVPRITPYAVRFMVEATGLLLGKFRPGENLLPWYRREVEPRLQAFRA
jgi:hypothetical protein